MLSNCTKRAFFWSALYYGFLFFAMLYARKYGEIQNWAVLLVIIPLLSFAISFEILSKLPKMNTKVLRPYSIIDCIVKFVAYLCSAVIFDIEIRERVSATQQNIAIGGIAVFYVISTILEIVMYKIAEKTPGSKHEKGTTLADVVAEINKDTEITVRQYFFNSLIYSIEYFLFLGVGQVVTFHTTFNDINMLDLEGHDSFSTVLVMFFTYIIIYQIFRCKDEIRTITANNERFLGYKAYVLFWTKVAYIPIYIIIAMLCRNLDLGRVTMVITLVGITSIYYLIFIIFAKKYWAHIKRKTGKLFVSRKKIIKLWHIEGNITEE